MPNILQRAITNLPNNGFSRAKKLADLAIKTNTDSKGSPTAAGYAQAIQLLQPYIASGTENQGIDAQRLIAGYSNSLDKLSGKQRDQNETVSAFKMQEQDAYFTKADGDYGSFRNPADLVGATSQALDGIVLGVMNAIDEKNANGESTDALEGYLKDISSRADQMRTLDTKFNSGQLGDGQVLDGFGYFVDTNPLDGSIRGAAIMPIANMPDKMGEGFKRLDATATLGKGMLPVYAPATQDQYGDYTAKIGDASWSGNPSNGALGKKGSTSSDYLFQAGGFDLKDNTKFALNKTVVNTGSFVSGLVGRDSEGNPVEGIFYKGVDNKVYKVDQATYDQFKNDPILGQKIAGYIPRVSPSDAQLLLKESAPISPDRITREGKIAGFQSAAETAKAESDRLNNLGFFGKIGEGIKGMTGTNSLTEAADKVVSGAAVDFVTPGIPAVSKFFANRINRQSSPDQAPTGGSGNAIIDAGKTLFRKVGSFFGAK